MLKGSPDLLEAEELARKAEEAARLAQAKQDELNRLWNEWSSLLEKADKIKLQLAQIANSLESLPAYSRMRR